jgi:hydrogenase maturation protease
MLRTFLSLVGLLIACVGIGLFVAIGVYVWPLKTEVNRQTTALAAQASRAGDAADNAVGFVRKVIGQAGEDLKEARKAAATVQPATQVNPLEAMIARKATQDLAGSVERAHGAVTTASDAVVVAQAALEVFNNNEPLQQFFGVNSQQMEATTRTLGNVTNDLRQARTVLGVPFGNNTLTQEQLNAVDNALSQASGFTDEMANVVTAARTRVNDAKTTADKWAVRIAVATSVLCALAAVGQVFFARFCWRTFRRLPA